MLRNTKQEPHFPGENITKKCCPIFARTASNFLEERTPRVCCAICTRLFIYDVGFAELGWFIFYGWFGINRALVSFK